MATLKARIQSLELQSRVVNFELGDVRHMTDADLVRVITGKHSQLPVDYPTDDELMILMGHQYYGREGKSR
jgi:hypothetical protein